MVPQRLALALVVALAPALLPGTAGADVRIYGRISGVPALAPGVAFALHGAREDIALAYGPDADSETLQTRLLGLTLSEAVGERTRLGLRLGRLWTSQSGRAATDGIDPDGHYINLALGTHRPLASGIQVTFDASWRYAVAEASDNDTERRLEWQTLTLRPALRFPLRERAALRAGASLVALDGDERLREPEGSTTTGFESDGHVGGFLALEFLPRPADVVTFRVEGGPRSGVFVSFEHRY